MLYFSILEGNLFTLSNNVKTFFYDSIKTKYMFKKMLTIARFLVPRYQKLFETAFLNPNLGDLCENLDHTSGKDGIT